MNYSHLNKLKKKIFGLKLFVILLAQITFTLSASAQGEATHIPNNERQPNVLFICVDDLKPWLGCYGNKFIKTPQIDKLAASGQLFMRHYVQAATCGASRQSMLTGRLPRTPFDTRNEAARIMNTPEGKKLIPMPLLFKKNNYTTITIGKVSHAPGHDFRGSWSRVHVFKDDFESGSDKIILARPTAMVVPKDDSEMHDGKVALAAIAELQKLKKSDKNFFLAIGFRRPHLPFYAPQKYWDLYDPKEIGLANYRETPKNADRKISLHESFEMRGQYKQIEGEGTDKESYMLRHGYAACVSLIDAQVGKVLAELDRLDLRKNTLIILWSDHGWHLGDHGTWGKHTVYEHSLRSPLIISGKGITPGGVQKTIVDSIDIYPTLTELCGLGRLKQMDGESLVPLMKGGTLKNDFAIGFLPDICRGKHKPNGYSMRTDRYRIVIWKDKSTEEWIDYVELYDHQKDPDETNNIAANKPELVQNLKNKLITNLK